MKRGKIARNIIMAILGIIIVLAAVVLVKTFTYPFEKRDKNSIAEQGITEMPTEQAISRLAGGIRIPTVSNIDYSQTDFRPFADFMQYLQESYPQVYAGTDTMTVNEYAMVFRWKGSDPSLAPILFLSHYDVVPVLGYGDDNTLPYDVEQDDDIPYLPFAAEAAQIGETQTSWDFGPFSGAVSDGRIYGRGTLDMKGMLFSIMEAADSLMSSGFTPRRDIWFAFGHDEEVSGRNGALKVAEYFQSQGMRFDAVFDEGGIIAGPGTGGIDRSMALIGTTEKGFLSLRIKVRGIGGHSSMPPAKSSLVMAAEIINKLNTEQMPARLIPPIESFLDRTGGEMGFGARMAIANKWLLKPLLLSTLSKNQATNALARTTTAITMAKGSEASNVIASIAEVVVNFRLLAGDSVSDVIAHVNKICEGYDTEIEIISEREPSNISAENTRGFEVTKESAARLYPDAIITSYVTIGGTDAYKYEIVSDNVYRFMPVHLNTYEQGTIHNENEHITLRNYGGMINHFRYLMENYD